MEVREALARLESLGKARNREVYARHGVRGPQFGVSYADLGKLAKQWKGEHELALALWTSGNHDARVLALMIADPERLRARELDAWARALDSHPLSDALARVTAGSPDAARLEAKWRASRSEWIAATGWNLLAARLGAGAEVPAKELRARLREIETGIHRAQNRVRHAMNGALIGIGVASEELRDEALAAARRIGTVEVDHGATSCKTPDAAAYIAKTLAHRARRSAGKRTSAGARKPARKTSAER